MTSPNAPYSFMTSSPSTFSPTSPQEYMMTSPMSMSMGSCYSYDTMSPVTPFGYFPINSCQTPQSDVSFSPWTPLNYQTMVFPQEQQQPQQDAVADRQKRRRCESASSAQNGAWMPSPMHHHQWPSPVPAASNTWESPVPTASATWKSPVPAAGTTWESPDITMSSTAGFDSNMIFSPLPQDPTWMASAQQWQQWFPY